VGFVLLLLVLAVVGVLAKDALLRYGELGGTSAAGGAALRQAQDPAPRPQVDAAAAPSPTAPIERARAVEDVLSRQADERAQQADRVAR
jgi:hypothetical protein